MGALFSKKSSKVAPETTADKPQSAPSRLEGLDGTNPAHCVEPRRAITPNQDYPGAQDAGPISPGAGGKRAPKKIDVIGKQTDGAQLAQVFSSAAVPLPEEGKPWAKVFDERIVKDLYSGSWKDREQGLTSVSRAIQSPAFANSKDANEAYMVSTQIAARSIKDKVSPIYHASLDLMQTIMHVYGNLLPGPALQAGLDPLMPALIHRCGNLNSRIHEASLQAILNIASYPKLGTAYVGPFALSSVPKVAKDANASAQMYGRLELICGMLVNNCAPNSMAGLGLQDTLTFAKAGLDMPDEKVRSCAIKVVVEVYKLRKSAGEDLEPERYLGAMKPALLQILHRKFAEASSETGINGRGDARGMATGVNIKVSKGLPPMTTNSSSTNLGRGNLPPIGSSNKFSRPTTGSKAGPASPSTNRSNSKMKPAPPLSPKGGPSSSPKPKRLGTSSGRFAPASTMKASPMATEGLLDEEEESLIRYIAGDNENMKL